MRIERLEKGDRLGGGHFQNVVDRFISNFDFQNGRAEAGSIAFRAAEVEVAEKLHFDLLESQSTAAVAASFAGVERKCGRGELRIDGLLGVSK